METTFQNLYTISIVINIFKNIKKILNENYMYVYFNIITIFLGYLYRHISHQFYRTYQFHSVQLLSHVRLFATP